jgi:hypothetical protein
MLKTKGMGRIRPELAESLKSRPSRREVLGIEGRQDRPHAAMGTKYIRPEEEQRRKRKKTLGY